MQATSSQLTSLTRRYRRGRAQVRRAYGASVDPPNGHYYETNWTIDKLPAHGDHGARYGAIWNSSDLIWLEAATKRDVTSAVPFAGHLEYWVDHRRTGSYEIRIPTPISPRSAFIYHERLRFGSMNVSRACDFPLRLRLGAGCRGLMPFRTLRSYTLSRRYQCNDSMQSGKQPVNERKLQYASVRRAE